MTTTDYAATLNSLRTRVDAARDKSVRAQADHERASAEVAEALAALKEFGINTADEAKTHLADLQAKLDAAISEASVALDEAESSETGE